MDKPWYSIEQGSVHFIVMSIKHPWSEKSEQYNWMERDLSSVDRSRTPWVILIGRRAMPRQAQICDCLRLGLVHLGLGLVLCWISTIGVGWVGSAPPGRSCSGA
ncbi:nucleotide pyrophosphatase/phosphodiesterase-like [Hordeum vulgare]|nr:nucleotide pyrophosphatase/phosphodiesterase-like [Hordeum vulgare]